MWEHITKYFPAPLPLQKKHKNGHSATKKNNFINFNNNESKNIDDSGPTSCKLDRCITE